MKTLILYLAIVVVATISFLKAAEINQSNTTSNLLLENIEALADGGDTYPWHACGCKDDGDGCYCNKVFYACAKEPNA